LNILLGTDLTSTDEHDLADVDTLCRKSARLDIRQLPRLREFDRRRTARRGVLYEALLPPEFLDPVMANAFEALARKMLQGIERRSLERMRTTSTAPHVMR